MPIVKRPGASTDKTTMDPAAAERFINAAPDAAPAPAAAAAPVARSKVVVGKQLQVTFALPADLLIKVDQAAEDLSISRAAFIKQALARAVQAELN
jgi:hypothetical protein